MTARAFVESLRAERATLARDILELRREVRTVFPAGDRCRRVAAVMTREQSQRARRLLRPTRAAFLAMARQCIERRPTSHDTEYYSACGWDDYQSEVVAEARQHGYLLRAAARLVR